MRRLVLIIGGLVGSLLFLALVLPLIIPTEVYRSQIEQAGREQLGREVTIAGPIRLSILPRLQASASDVTIDNAEGFGADPFAEMNSLRLSLQLWPLLSGNIAVDEFILVEPVIRLEQAGTQNNWTFVGDESAPPPVPVPAETGGFRRPGALPFDASFGDIRLERGQLSFSDGTSLYQLDDVDMRLDLPSIDAPMRLTGDFITNGQPMDVAVALGSLKGFFEGQATSLDFSLLGPVGNIVFEGEARESSELAFQGAADIDLPLRVLAEFFGSELPEGDTFQRFEATSDLLALPGELSLSNTNLVFDAIQASGDMSVNYASDRPVVSGDLTIPDLDLTPYVVAEADPSRGNSQNSGIGPWSDTPIDLSPLGLIDGEITASVGRLLANDIEITEAVMVSRLDNGRMTTELTRFLLYGGEGRATAVANVRGATPSFSINANLDALQALPFLRDAAKFERLRGLGDLQLDLVTSGNNPAAIMNSLDGQGQFDFSEGAIVGANLAQIIRTVQSALETRQLPSGFGEEQETDFSALGGSFTVENGLAQNLDLTMLSPLLRVTGRGEVDLANQTVSYRLNPRAVQSLAGQGGDLDLRGLEVPISIQGNFNDVAIGLDWESIATSLIRARAGDLVGGQLGDSLGQGQSLEEAAGNAILDALTGDDEEEDGAEEDPARSLLRGILGGSRNQEEPAEETDDSENDNDGTDGGDGG